MKCKVHLLSFFLVLFPAMNIVQERWSAIQKVHMTQEIQNYWMSEELVVGAWSNEQQMIVDTPQTSRNNTTLAKQVNARKASLKQPKKKLPIAEWVIIFLLTMLICWVYITHRQGMKYAEEKLKRQRVMAQFESLKHQLAPHFLFNSLNALASLIQQDSKRAYEFTVQFAKLYLFALDFKDHLLVSLEDELEFCKAYLLLQQIRFGKNLKIDYQINTEQSQVSLPPMALQIALENALKHNQISAQAPLHICISEEAKKLVVQNNLQKKTSYMVDSTHIGLQNIKERYQLLGREQPEFIESATGFTVKLPLIILKK